MRTMKDVVSFLLLCLFFEVMAIGAFMLVNGLALRPTHILMTTSLIVWGSGLTGLGCLGMTQSYGSLTNEVKE